MSSPSRRSTFPGPAVSLLTLMAGLALLVACGPSDPREAVLKERSRWNVELAGSTLQEDGGISLYVQVSGPPRTSLEQLTFRVVLFDGERNEIGERWLTVNLDRVPRGAPQELFFVLDPGELTVDGLDVDRVLLPSPEQEPELVELRGL